MTIHIRPLILRYGVFVLLVLMSAGILFFVCSFELRVKTPIHLFYDGQKHCWHGYLDNQQSVNIQLDDTLLVVQTSVGDVPYIVAQIVPEPQMLHIILLPMRSEVPTRTYREGYIYIGNEKIKDKILKKQISIK